MARAALQQFPVVDDQAGAHCFGAKFARRHAQPCVLRSAALHADSSFSIVLGTYPLFMSAVKSCPASPLRRGRVRAPSKSRASPSAAWRLIRTSTFRQRARCGDSRGRSRRRNRQAPKPNRGTNGERKRCRFPRPWHARLRSIRPRAPTAARPASCGPPSPKGQLDHAASHPCITGPGPVPSRGAWFHFHRASPLNRRNARPPVYPEGCVTAPHGRVCRPLNAETHDPGQHAGRGCAVTIAVRPIGADLVFERAPARTLAGRAGGRLVFLTVLTALLPRCSSVAHDLTGPPHRP
jgi:hypothetical protein